MKVSHRQRYALGADYYSARIDKDRQARNLARHLQALTGQKITIHDGQVILHTT